MIRVLVYLVVVALIAFGAVWLAERPGEVAITWQGDRIDTSVMVLVAAAAAVAVAAVVLWSIVRAIVRAPDALARRRRARRGARGYRALSHGLIAVGSGDVRAARRFTQEAGRFAPGEPLTLLLRAQAAQLAGDRADAAATFQQMAERDDTRALGLHGLFVEAQRRNDAAAALFYAEEAGKQSPGAGSVPGWAGQAVLEFRCVAGDWSGALTRLEQNMKSGLIDKTAYRRQRAVLLTAQALAAEDGDRERGKALALEAVRLAPTLVPAAASAGRLLAASGERRKAARIIETAWRANPHPDLAEAYLRPGDSARQRLERIETLAAMAAGDPETAIAVARAALDAKEFSVAREALAPLVASPTKRVAALMGALELQQGDEGRGREWMARALNARRDPAWTADGFVSDRWLPVSPVTGRLDAFEWKDPLAGDEHAGAVIDAERHAMLEPPTGDAAAAGASAAAAAGSAGPHSIPAGATGEAGAQSSAREESMPERAADEPVEHSIPPSHEPAAASEPPGVNAAPPPVASMLHAPDDPGPGEGAATEPAPAPEPRPSADGWSRWRSLFRS